MDAELLRRVAGRFATGVTVVTTVAEDRDHAMTVNAFTSVSLDPLLVLFCAERAGRFHDVVARSGVWGVSVLSEGMRDAAEWFGTRGRVLDGRMSGWEHHRGPATGVALLSGAVATLECRTYAAHEAGDHTIVVGEVLGLDVPDPQARPLLFYEGGYRSIGD